MYYFVRDLDSRHKIGTHSAKIARQFWDAIIEAGGTPFCLVNGKRAAFV